MFLPTYKSYTHNQRTPVPKKNRWKLQPPELAELVYFLDQECQKLLILCKGKLIKIYIFFI